MMSLWSCDCMVSPIITFTLILFIIFIIGLVCENVFINMYLENQSLTLWAYCACKDPVKSFQIRLKSALHAFTSLYEAVAMYDMII